MAVQNLRYEELVGLLEERLEMKQVNGVEMVIKKIPDSNAEGEFDPRVLATVQKQNELSASEDMPDFSQIDVKDFPIERIRAQMGWPNVDVIRTEIETSHREIEGEKGLIPVRIYSPKQAGRLPAVLYFHGGGFIGGSVDTVENPCKALAEKAKAVVISVDYRLSPEYPFPAGLTDCFDAVTWVYKNAEELRINADQIAVSGDSAGGNLAAVCALIDKERGTKMIKYQALIYPVVNLGNVKTDDYKWNLDEYMILNHHELITNSIKGLANAGPLFNKLYLQGRVEMNHPHVSPLLAENVEGIPEALIITAEYDFLRLEGEAYARKLARAGVHTRLIQYNGMDHAFIDKIGIYPQAEDCMNEIAKGVRRIFA